MSLRPWLAQHCTWPANNFHFGRLQPSKSVEFQRAFRPCCADHVEDALPELPLPLCERHGRHEVPLASLLQWRATALQRASEVGESWTQQDDGPSQEDLVTELSWLLDDAVAEEATGGVGAGAGVSWRQLERELRMDSDRGVEGRLVVLREGLEYLGEWPDDDDMLLLDDMPLHVVLSKQTFTLAAPQRTFGGAECRTGCPSSTLLPQCFGGTWCCALVQACSSPGRKQSWS